MEGIVFERLEKGRHNRDEFDCGVEELNAFLKQIANQQQSKGLNAVYVAVGENDDYPKKIYGFYTLSASALSFQSLPEDFSKKIPRNYPVPTIKIGRLAKDKLAPKGFGGLILGVALKQALQLSKEIGVVAVDVDAKNDKAKHFYTKHGFLQLKDDPMGMFLAINVLEQINKH